MKKKYVGVNQNTIDKALNLSRLNNLFRSFWGMIAEFVILYSLTVAIFLMVPEIQYSFLTMNIHPLMFISCYIGIRHGFLAGLLSALLSSLIYFFSYSFLNLDPILFFQSYEYYKFPMIFTLGGYLSGRIYDTNSRKIQEMRDANVDVLHEYDELEKTYKKTILMYNELKEQIVGSEYSIFSLYDIASSLQTTNPEKVYTEAIGLLYKFIKARALSIYTIENGDYMRLKIRFGNKGQRVNSRKYTDSPMYNKLMKTKRAVRWNPEAGSNAPVFSAPIVAEGVVIGIIDIEDIEFEFVTEYSFSIFQVISEWIAKALSQALEIDKQFHLMGLDYSNMLQIPQFERQLEEEMVRKEKYGLPYCQASYDLGFLDSDEVIPKLQKTLRNVDYLCYDQTHNMARILLPATDEENYIIVEKRIFDSLGFRLERAV